jgi:hypothetical protein
MRRVRQRHLGVPIRREDLHQETKVPPYADAPFLLLAQQHLALKPDRITIVQWRWTENVAER